VIQSFALALPVIFIQRIAAKKLSKWATWTIVASYLLYPGVLWPALSDFHLEAFVPLAYVMTFYFWEEDRRTPFVLSYFLLLSTFELASVIGISFLLYAWLKARRYRTTPRIGIRVLLFLAVLSFVWYAGATLVMQLDWPQRGAYLPNYWGLLNLGVDVAPKLYYWATLLVTLAFAPLAATFELITAAPWFVASIFSNFANYYTLPWQYSALVSGQFVIAAIFALQRLERLKFHRAVIALTFVGLVGLSPFGAFAIGYQPNFVPSLPGDSAIAGHQALSVVPPNATVLAQDNVLPFLVDRLASVYSNYPNDSAPPKFIVLDIPEKYYFLHDPPDAPIQNQSAYFLNRYNYGLVASADGFLVYELGYAGQLKVYVPYFAEVPATYFGALVPLGRTGGTIDVSPGFHGLAWNGPWYSLGQGKYRITFFVGNLSPNSSVTLDAVYFADNITFARKVVSFPTQGRYNATLDISLSGIVPEIEFRGTIGPNQSANISFEGVQVTQLSAP
jgi:uncharacterized membrane protein